jgi:hypothetical protein
MRGSLARVGNPCMSGVDHIVSIDTDVFAGLMRARSARVRVLQHVM